MSQPPTTRSRRFAGAAVLPLLVAALAASPADAAEIAREALTFSSAAPDDAVVGEEAYEPTTSGGVLGVPVLVTTATTDVCVYDAEADGFVFTAPGTCTVTAEQTGADGALLGEQATQSFEVAAAPETSTPETPQPDRAHRADQRTPPSAPAPASPSPTSPSPFAPDASAPTTGDDTAAPRRRPSIEVVVTSEEEPNAAGWYRTPVTVSFTCTAGSAPLRGACPTGFERRNTEPDFVVRGSVTDTTGRSARVALPLKVDSARPELDLDITGQDLFDVASAPLRCVAVDGRSGLTGPCAIALGEPEEGADGVTRREWAVAAVDKAGNVSLRSGFFRSV